MEIIKRIVMLSFQVITNIYLIVIFIGVLVILVKLYDLKLLLKTFFETATLLGRYVDRLEQELHKEEEIIGQRVNRVYDDVLDILERLDKSSKDT